MNTTTKSKSWITGLTAAIAASLCCIAPVIAFSGGVVSAFSWIAPFRPYLVGVTVLAFAFAWYQKLKPRKQACCNGETGSKKSFWQSTLFLSIITVIAALLTAFPYYAGLFYPKPAAAITTIAGKADMQQAVFRIEGMTCESCASHINSEIKKVKGVIQFQTSYEKTISIVKFNNTETTIDDIAAAINSTGYKVVSQTKMNH